MHLTIWQRQSGQQRLSIWPEAATIGALVMFCFQVAKAVVMLFFYSCQTPSRAHMLVNECIYVNLSATHGAGGIREAYEILMNDAR